MVCVYRWGGDSEGGREGRRGRDVVREAGRDKRRRMEEGEREGRKVVRKGGRGRREGGESAINI